MAEIYVLDFGAANAGGAPAWSIFARTDTNVDVAPHPTFTEVGGGLYSFPYEWATAPSGCTSITFKATLNGIELSDVITTQPFAVPGTVSTQGYSTAGSIINRAAVQVGLAAVANPYTSADPAFVQLVEFLKVVGDEIQAEFTWQHLVRECSITAASSVLTYDLPSDFRAMVPDTAWNRSSRFPMAGPLTPQQTQYLKVLTSAGVVGVPYRLYGNQIKMPTAPPNGASLVFEYLSTYWVQSAAALAPDKSAPTATDDICLFDPLLLVRGLKYQWLSEKGLPSDKAAAEYKRTLEDLKGRNASGHVLSLNAASGFRLVDGGNYPATGWGI